MPTWPGNRPAILPTWKMYRLNYKESGGYRFTDAAERGTKKVLDGENE